GLNGFEGALTFGADRYLQNAGMPEVGANAAANTVGESALGADVVEQARGETSAKSLVEDSDGVIIGIVAGGAERHHVDGALVHVVFGDQVVAGLGWSVLNIIFRERWTLGPRIERRAQPGFHCGRIEVAADPENDVVGLNIFGVPIDQILTCDG